MRSLLKFHFMELKTIEISNFRCFSRFRLQLAKKTTVLIGKNGAGKSTLIHAIHKALSFAFISDRHYDGFLLADGIKSLKPENFTEGEDFLMDPETGKPVKEITITASAKIDKEELKWAMQASTLTYILSKSAYDKAAYKFLDIVNQRKILPVFAFYSDTFPYRSKKTIPERIAASPTFGYYCWNSYSGMTSYFVERLAQNLNVINFHTNNIAEINSSIQRANEDGFDFVKYSGHTISHQKILIQKEKEERALKDCIAENKTIESALLTFTENDEILPFNRFRPGRQNGSLLIEDNNDKLWSLEHLPAGYKRILYIVIDIAFRSYLLNKGAETDGVVIIDEVDLHLHPSLEATVMERFHRTFPKIQFVVTTHSALVISNINTSEKEGVRNNLVYKMAEGWEEPQVLPNLRGIDANAMYNDYMETPSRDIRLEKKLNKYVELFSRERMMEAQNMLEEIKTEFGDTDFLKQEIKLRLDEL